MPDTNHSALKKQYALLQDHIFMKLQTFDLFLSLESLTVQNMCMAHTLITKH